MVNTVESGETPKSNGINNGSSNNGAGPRVSFNRDVHVKRYGTQLNHNDHLNSSFESLPTQTQSSAKFHRELPTDLSEEALEREAALVLEQANYFGQSNTSSLPSRKNRRGPVRRSISDASAAAKKTKRNSIFNIFNTNSNTTNTSAVNKKPTNLNEKHAKKVERSKSDVSSRSSSQGSKRDKYRNSIHLNTNNLHNNSYNNKTINNNNYNNSDSSENFLQPVTSTPKRIPLTPITEVNSPSSDVNSRSDYFDGLVEATKANKAKLSKGNIGYTSREDLDLIPSTDKMKSKHSKSMDAMHCSQMPADKPTLTKGAAVDTMIKRLSIEPFSPPPIQVIGVGGFSYTNPHNNTSSISTTTTTTATSPTTILTVNPSLVITQTKHKSLSPPLTTLKSDNDIVYAQVVCNELKNVNGNKIHSKETVHNTIPRKNRHSASPPPNIKTQFQKTISHNNDFVTATASSPIPENGNYRNSVKIIRDYPDNGRDDIDGNGITAYGDEEPIIKPNIRYHIPRYSTTTTITTTNNNYNHNNNYNQNNNNNHHHQYNHNNHNNEFNNNYEMRDTDYNVDISLSNRREILESRIKSRIGGLHTTNNDSNNVIINRIQNTSSSPPTTKRYHKYGSNEIVNRYSPERTHLDFIQPTTVSHHQQQQQQKHYQENYTDNNTLRKKSYNYNKTPDKGDSGIEVDNVSKSNGKKKPSYISRFNIGRKWNHKDDIIECELFLMKEKKHTEETYPFQLVKTYVYRERSIDDGSHYDPNIDKLNILKDIKKNNKIAKDFLQSKKKKKSGMDKVKELFKSKSKSPTDVDDNDVRARYREYSPNPEPPSKVVNAHQEYIANRRRLSTPTASPITNRSVSLPPKSKKISSQLATSNGTMKRDKENGNQAQKFSWFTSLDRSKKKVKDPAADTANRKYFTMNKATSLKNISAQSANSGSNKTLRFFGDTDADDVESISKAKGKKMTAFQEARTKSSSMQNLNPSRKPKQNKSVSRSRIELQNISESTSDTEFNEFPIRRPASPIIVKNLPPPRPPKTTNKITTKTVSTSSTTLPRPPRRKMYDEDEVDREFVQRDVQESLPFYQKKESFESDSLANLTSARKLKESMSASRENMQRDRFDSDASLRSVVYLHATTVGDIPSQTLGRSKVSGRNSVKTAIQENQPMTRTVNRSVSLNAPWKPKLISDGYEINYNNEQQKGKYHQNNMRSKSASREQLTERSRSRNEKRSDSSKRI